METVYDTIIIGAGPAGIAAGIYASRREMKTLIIGFEVGGQMLWSSEIENYPGFKKTNNVELTAAMRDQVESLGVKINQSMVKNIKKEGDIFVLHTDKEVFKTKTVIAATGATPRRLAIPGEEEFSSKGVTYCANCDGPFYKGQVVAVVGGGNSALDAAEMMGKIASKVYLIHRSEKFRGFEVLIREVQNKDNIEIILNSEVKEIMGDTKVNKIKIVNNKDNSERELEVGGVFIEIGHIAKTDLVADFVERNEQSEIMVDEKCATKTPGFFAAGDTTQVPYKQISIASGQGTIAALSAYQYLQLKEEGQEEENLLDRGTVEETQKRSKQKKQAKTTKKEVK